MEGSWDSNSCKPMYVKTKWFLWLGEPKVLPDFDHQLSLKPPGLLTGVQQWNLQPLAALGSKGRVGIRVGSLGVEWVSGFRQTSNMATSWGCLRTFVLRGPR